MGELTLGQKIRRLRLDMKMTQKDLAGDFITRNMLSQIENDNAAPSMKTMAYLSEKLDRPIGYFLDKGQEEAHLSHMMARLIVNEAGDYEVGVRLLEKEIENNAYWTGNKMMMDLYRNSHMILAVRYWEAEDYHNAKSVLRRILKYEGQLLKLTDIDLYKTYDLLAEVCSQTGDVEEAKAYYEKGRQYINRLVASREVQALYIKMMEGDDEALLKAIDLVDASTYDNHSLARFQMIAGTSMYRRGHLDKAIELLETSLSYYEQHTDSSVTAMIYEELSKCYSGMDQYKKAYKCLQKAQQNHMGMI